MKNKRGWIRIAEAVIGILLLAGVLLVMYSQHRDRGSDYDYVYEMQKKVLDKIALNYRSEVINEELQVLESVARSSFPDSFGVNVSVCNLDVVCSQHDLPVDREIFVEERIISADLGVETAKLFKKVRVFVWEV